MNTSKAQVAPSKSEEHYVEKLVQQFDNTEDPIARVFKKNQKIISYILIAVCIAVVGYRLYQGAHTRGQLDSANVFTDVRSNYELLAKQDDAQAVTLPELEKAQRSFEGSAKTLQEQNYPYDLLAKNYQVMAQIASGNLPLSDVRKKLEELEWSKSKNSPNAIWKELLALNLAKTLLVDENQQEFALGQIKSLAQESEYVRVPSLITWRSYADTKQNDQELEAASIAIEDFSKAFPEQSDLLK